MKDLTIYPINVPNLFRKQKAKTTVKPIFWDLAMAISIACAITISGLGLTLSGMSYLGLVVNPESINEIGTFMMVFAAPLFFFAAHCMDKIDLKNKKSKSL